MVRQLAEREILIANQYLRRCSISSIFEGMQIKILLPLYVHHLEKLESQVIPSAGEEVGKRVLTHSWRQRKRVELVQGACWHNEWN